MKDSIRISGWPSVEGAKEEGCIELCIKNQVVE